MDYIEGPYAPYYGSQNYKNWIVYNNIDDVY